jgi:cell division protein FtsB
MNWRALWLWVQSLGYWVFLAIVAAGAALLFIPLWFRQENLKRDIRRLDAEILRLETLEKQQKSEIEALKSDPTYVERVAREKLNLSKPNETVVQFLAPAGAVTNQPRR